MNHSYFCIGVICLITFAISGVMAADAPSLFSPGLKASEASKPYEDAYFTERATYAISHLTKPLPTGSDLIELKNIYYDIIMKNISPDYYNEARDITKYLFYTMKAADGMEQYDESIKPGRIVLAYHEDLYKQASLDGAMARKAFSNIRVNYPNIAKIIIY